MRMSSAHRAASMKSISPRCNLGSFSRSSRQRSAYQGCFSNNVFITATVRGLSLSRSRYAIAPMTMCVGLFQADAEEEANRSTIIIAIITSRVCCFIGNFCCLQDANSTRLAPFQPHTTMPKTVLLVDDDEHLRETLCNVALERLRNIRSSNRHRGGE
jgi:hypothetical protein